MTRLHANAALRRAQAASWRGRHEAAERELAAARRLHPALPHLALQAALLAARAGRLEEAQRRLREAPEPLRATPVYRLFEGWLLARDRRAKQAVPLLEAVVAEVPENRVAATALAYALLRTGELDRALSLLDPAGDNPEILSWAWLELERAVQHRPPPADPPLPTAPAVPPGAARRWLASALAAVEHRRRTLLRGALLERSRRPRSPWRLLRPLLEALERRAPTDPLPALLSLVDSPDLAIPLARARLYLGCVLYERGNYQRALIELERVAVAPLDSADSGVADSPRTGLESGVEGLHLDEAELGRLCRALTLVELRRWDAAEAALEAVGQAAADEGEEAVHEFSQPDWLLARARLRLARGDERGAWSDLARVLELDPVLFDLRLRRLQAQRANR